MAMRRLRQFVRDANSPLALVDSRGLLVVWSAPFARLCKCEPTEGMPIGTALGILDEFAHEPGCYECDQEYRDLRIVCLPATTGGDQNDRLVLVHAPLVSPESGAGLTHRSCEVLRLVADGMTNKEIAQHLNVSVSAVKKHLERLFAHYGVRRRFELLTVVETIDSDDRREMQ